MNVVRHQPGNIVAWAVTQTVFYFSGIDLDITFQADLGYVRLYDREELFERASLKVVLN